MGIFLRNAEDVFQSLSAELEFIDDVLCLSGSHQDVFNVNRYILIHRMLECVHARLDGLIEPHSDSLMVSLSCRAFQNGIQLDSAFIYNHEKYDSGDSMKDIQPGASIELMEAYVLSSETAPIEFEVEESFSFAGEKLGQLFVISDETSIRLSAAPEGDFTAEVGDYTVSIVSYKLTEDYEGSPAILIELGFTNNSDEPAIFASSVSFSAFQDGIELDTAYIYGDDSGSGTSQMRYIKPGAGATVTKAFVLTSETSVIDIEIEEYFSFSGETIKTEISLEG